MTEFVILLILVLINGVFSMSEIAFVSSRKARLENQANKGDKQAAKALELSKNPDTFLSTVQIGITLIGIITGFYSGDKLTDDAEVFISKIPLLAPYSSTIASAVVVLVITYLSLVLGELVPKRIGLAMPEKLAKLFVTPMVVLSKIAYPFIWLLSVSSNALVKLFNLSNVTDNQVTEEEIKAIINEGKQTGAIEEIEQDIVERLFHLGDRSITSLMTHRSDIAWMDVNDSAERIKEKMKQELHSMYPVCDGQIDKLLGVVSVKELFLYLNEKPLRELIRPASFIPEQVTAFQLLERFRETKIHHSFIVDEYGTMLGLVTINDILESLVGELPTPEEEDYTLVLREDGSALVDGGLPFYKFLEYYDMTEFMDEFDQEFDTMGGFVLNHLKHIPELGEKFHWRDWTFEIVDMDRNKIDKILVTERKPEA